jgi:diguanylate cyclase (GGDEF)-like protein
MKKNLLFLFTIALVVGIVVAFLKNNKDSGIEYTISKYQPSGKSYDLQTFVDKNNDPFFFTQDTDTTILKKEEYYKILIGGSNESLILRTKTLPETNMQAILEHNTLMLKIPFFNFGRESLAEVDWKLTPATIYVKKSYWRNVYPDILIQKQSEFYKYKFFTVLFSGAILGSIFILMVYHGILFIKTQKKIYAEYSFLALALGVFTFIYKQADFGLLINTSANYHLYLYAALLAAGGGFYSFSNSLFEFSRKKPKLNAFALGMLLSMTVCVLGILVFTPYVNKGENFFFESIAFCFIKLAFFFGAALLGSIVFTVIRDYTQYREKLALQFLLAWTPVLVFYIIHFFINIGVINDRPIFSIAEEILLVGAMVSFAYILAGIIERINTKLAEERLEIRKSKQYDFFTGLNNRRAFVSAMKISSKETIIFIDIDDFKYLNNKLGHDVGDEILLNFAAHFKSFFEKKGYLCFRTGGNEFAALYSGNSKLNLHLHQHFAQKYIESLRQIKFVKNHILRVNIGLCIEEENAIEKASAALAYAKNSEESLVLYTEKIDKTVDKKYNDNFLHNEIMHAHTHGGILPFFQPIVDRDGKVVKYESLMRIRSKDDPLKFLSPAVFMDFLKENKIYKEISLEVIEKAFEVFQYYDKNLSINLNYKEVADEKSSTKLLELIKKYNIGHKLTIELTETDDIENHEILAEFVSVVRKTGAKIAIDDFGTGFSNFERILKIKPDFVKLDGSIVKHITEDENFLILIQGFVNICKDLQIQTIAEYISDINVYNKAKFIGVDFFQGFLFGEARAEPLREEEVYSIIQKILNLEKVA